MISFNDTYSKINCNVRYDIAFISYNEKEADRNWNSLLEKYVNKLNFNNLPNILVGKKVFYIFVAFFILFLSYLSIPHTYNKIQIQKELVH